MIDNLKKLIFETIILTHGTSRTNFEGILKDGKVGGGNPNWNVSKDWVYFWNSFNSIKEVLENDGLSDDDLCDEIVNSITNIQESKVSYKRGIDEVLSLMSEIEDDERDDIAEQAISLLFESAAQNDDFSMDECEQNLRSIVIFDGRNLDLEVDDSCPNMEGATRVPSPVNICTDNGYLGVAEQISIHEPSSELSTAISEALYEIDTLEYATEEERAELNKLEEQIAEEYDDEIQDEIYELQDSIVQRLDMSDGDKMGTYHTYLKLSRETNKYDDTRTVFREPKCGNIKLRREIAQAMLGMTLDIFEEEYFDTDNYTLTRAAPKIGHLASPIELKKISR